MSSQELTVVRSSGLSSSSRSAGSGRGGFPRPGGAFPVEWLGVFEQVGEFWQGWLSPAGCDIHGRVHDRDPECLDGPDRRDGILEQELVIHRADRGQLRGLVVDKQERRILRGDEMVGERVAHWGAGHERLLLVANAARPTLVAVMVSS